MLDYLRESFVAHAAGIAGPLAIAVVGIVLSILGRRIIRSLVRRSGLEAAAEGAGIAPLLYMVGAREGLGSFLGTVTFWAGLLATLAALCERLGLSYVRDALGSVLGYAPRLGVALAIAFGGIFLGSIVQRAVERIATARSDMRAPGPIAASARGLVIMVAITLAAQQAGLQIEFLTTVFEIVVGAICLALGLAFALGFHGLVRGMAARHYYKPLVRPGDHITIGDAHGTVVKFGSTAVVLRDAGEERIVPCERMLTGTVVITVDRDGERR
jgi:hypothetical protein